MKYFIALYVAAFVGCFQIWAEDYTVQPVVDVKLTGSQWDLTGYEPIGPEIDVHSEIHDGIVSFWMPTKRLDFVNRNDTTLQVCAETRKYRTIFGPGILCDVKSGNSASMPFVFKGRIYQREFVHGNGMSTLGQSVNGRVVTRDGNVQASATVTHCSSSFRWTLSTDSIIDLNGVADSLMCETTVDRYILTAHGRTFPLAFKRVTRTLYMGQEVEADSAAWITTYSPDDALLDNEQLKRRLNGNTLPDDGLDGQTGRGTVSVAVDGDDLLVTISTVDEDGVVCGPTGPVRIVITDILGRQYIDIRVTAEGKTRVNASALSRGEYLLQVIAGDGQVVDAVKFTR